MDLIYTDSHAVDQGILQDYSLDMEYGIGDKNTNEFECQIQKYNPAMQGENRINQDSLLYIEFTEYGGVVDRIESNTKTGVITLSGRTWHGILNSFVIEPPAGLAHRVYNGVLSSVLTQMLEDVGLDTLFEVDPEEAGDEIITIYSFEVRYELLYSAMIRMLNLYNAKFTCYYHKGKVHIKGLLAANYAVVDEFDSSQVPFKVGITYNNVNHVICLGQGNGSKRAVIHLFTDGAGNVQPYTKVANPLQDSDYILDKSRQVMTGVNERAYIYDYSSAEITYNYIVLTKEPPNWKVEYYKKYFKRGEDDESGNPTYDLLQREFKDRFELLNKEPSDWDENKGYKNYYTCDSTGTTGTPVQELQEDDPECEKKYVPEGGKYGQFWDWNTGYAKYYEYFSLTNEYKQVTAKTIEIEDNPITTQPSDWIAHYSNYNTRWWNGTKWVYEQVKGKDHYEYEAHKSEPTDWETNYGGYYTVKKKKNKKGKWEKVSGKYITVSQAMNDGWLKPVKGKKYPKWAKNKFFNRNTITDPPAFPGVVYYTIRREVAPDWVDGVFYERIIDKTPKFKKPDPANGFYGYWKLHKNEEQIPTWTPNTYYYEVEDRYRVLISQALEKLEDLCDTSTLDIDLELESGYDVGDIVGSVDEVTKIEVNKPILRKIIKIKKDIVSISYEVE